MAYNLDNRSYNFLKSNFSQVEFPLDKESAPNPEHPMEVLTWANEVCSDLIEGRVEITFLLPDGSITLRAIDALLDGDGSPAVAMRLPDAELYLYTSAGQLHMVDAPACCLFMNRSDVHFPAIKGIKEKPSRKWSWIEFTSYQHGEPTAWPLQASYHDVSYWDIDDTACMTHTDLIVLQANNGLKPAYGDTLNLHDKAFVKGKYMVEDVELYQVVDEYDFGMRTAHTPREVDLSWVKPVEIYASSAFQKELKPVTQEVNTWLDKNLDGQLDVFSKELFTDALTEFRFLEEFQQ